MAGGQIPARLKPVFMAAGHAYGIPPEVLAGVADVESTLGADRSTSSAGAVGLMQFLPSTAAGLGVDPRNDSSAIWGAAKYLHQLGYSRDPMRALGAYNGGPANPEYSYARQVMASAQRLKPELTATRAATSDPLPGADSAIPTQKSVGSDLLRGLITAGLAGAGATIAGLGIHAMLHPSAGPA